MTGRIKIKNLKLRAKIKKIISEYILVIVFFVGAIFVWEFGVKWANIPSFILPAPSEIASKFVSYSARLVPHFFVTIKEVIIGFLVGVGIGTSAGIAITYSNILKRIIYPIAIAIRVTPMVAIAPLIIVWFGFGITSKVITAAIITLFPIIVNTAAGLLAVEPESIELMQSLGAKKWQIFSKLRFPNALPYYFAGLKIAIGGSVIGAVIAEFVAPTEGLGYLIIIAMTYLDASLLFVALVALFLMGIGLFGSVTLLEKFLVPWKEEGS